MELRSADAVERRLRTERQKAGVVETLEAVDDTKRLRLQVQSATPGKNDDLTHLCKEKISGINR